MSDKNFIRYKVRDLIEHHMSGPSPTCEERPVSDSKEWGLLKTTAVVWEGWNPNAHKVPPCQYWNNTRIEVKAGDVLITKAGPRERVGVVVYVDETPPRLMVSGKMIGLRPNKSLINSRVLAAVLSINKTQRFLDSRTTGMADSQLNFTNELLLYAEVEVPPIEQQHRISTLINLINKQISQTEALIHKYQQIKAGLMHDLFTRGVTADGKLRPPREQAPELYKETPVGWIPKEWNVKRVGDLCLSIVPGRDKPILDGGYLPWITVSDIERLNVFESLEGLSLSRNSLKKAHGRTIPKRAVIMSCVGSFGLVAITGKELVINQQLHAFVVGDKIIPEWLSFNLERQERYMNKIATQTTIRYLNKDSCESVPIVVPTKNEQQLLVERIISISDQIFVEQQVVSKLKKQKSGLMYDLLTGKVQVKIDQKETAHV